MRELTRSMIRFTWSMPLLGVNQLASLVVPSEGQSRLDSAAETLDALAEVAYRQMGPSMQDLYSQGDRLQHWIVDAMFGILETDSDTGQASEAWRPAEPSQD